MEKKHNIDKFQGYPHYPAKDDITRVNNNDGTERLPDDEKPTRQSNDTVDPEDNEVAFVSGTDADVSAEDLRMLDAAEQNMNTQDAMNLMASSLDNTDDDGDRLNVDDAFADDMTGEDLDIPGSSTDNANENIGEEDEENNYYSLGGDLHESQEENKGE
jgi:hypothetical protein